MKRKRRRQTAGGLVLAGCLLAATACPAAENDRLSGELFDFQLLMDGQLYIFPMDYGDFTALGWEAADPETEGEELEPGWYEKLWVQMDGRVCRVYVMNPGEETCLVSESRIGGIELDSLDFPPDLAAVELPGGILRGVSTLEEIEAAYGEPDQIYDGELYIKYVYQRDIYSEVELSVYHESGVLEDIEVENLSEIS